MSVARSLLDFGFFGLAFALFIGTGHWFRVICIFLLFRALTSQAGLRYISCLPRDISGVILLAIVKWKIGVAFNRDKPINYYFQHWVKTVPDKPCVIEIETGRTLTFREINDLANKYANYLMVGPFCLTCLSADCLEEWLQKRRCDCPIP